jgi:hypothetical protein
MIDRPVKHMVLLRSELVAEPGANRVTADENAPSGPPAADAVEVIHVNVKDPSGLIRGVLLYYAVLAYPQRSEWPKRRAFIEALIAMRFREFAVQGVKRADIPDHFRRYKKEKMLCRFRLGWKRVDRRINAALMAWCIYLNGKHHLFESPTADGKVGIYLQGPNTVNAVVRALVASRPKSSNPAHLESESAEANVAHRIWAESFPVLHLAMENPITLKVVEALISGQPPSEKHVAKELFDSLHEPTWLRATLEDAENLKAVLSESLGSHPSDPRGLGYKSERAISILPTENAALAYRS